MNLHPFHPMTPADKIGIPLLALILMWPLDALLHWVAALFHLL